MNELMKQTVTIKPVENVVGIQYNYTDGEHETKLTFSDGSLKYILITADMIFVSDWPKAELDQHITVDDCVLYEAYDTVDGCAYYLCSEYAAEIADAMINFQHRLLAERIEDVYLNTAAELLDNIGDSCSDYLGEDESAALKETFEYLHQKAISRK